MILSVHNHFLDYVKLCDVETLEEAFYELNEYLRVNNVVTTTTTITTRKNKQGVVDATMISVGGCHRSRDVYYYTPSNEDKQKFNHEQFRVDHVGNCRLEDIQSLEERLKNDDEILPNKRLERETFIKRYYTYIDDYKRRHSINSIDIQKA